MANTSDFDTDTVDTDTSVDCDDDSGCSDDSDCDDCPTEEVSTMSDSTVSTVDTDTSSVVSVAAPVATVDPDSKLLEGIDFSDREVMAKQAELAATRTRIESFQKALVSNQEREAELELELENVEPSSDRRSEALAKVSVMRSIGMNNDAIRAALKQQYGMIKPNANRPLSPPNSPAVDQHVKVRKLSEAGQARVLELVRAAGVNGIGRADIKDALEKEGVVVSDENDVSKVLKNAVLDGVIVASGLTKGMKYSVC
jgi:hypothetical protein